MKRRARVLAGILVGCMIFGQTVFAEEAVSEDQMPEETAEVASEETENEGGERVQEAKTGTAAKEDISEEPDTSFVQQDEPAAAEVTVDDSHAEEISMTMYEGIPYHMEQICEEMPWYFEAVSSDEDICQASEPVLTQPNGNFSACFNITPVKAGETDISLWSVSYENASADAEIRVKEAVYHIEVKELPSDAVEFNDPVLVKELMDNNCDRNNDGYISQEELERAESLGLSRTYWSVYEEGEFITDLTGMEYAVNVTNINLSGNSTLKDISPLSGLKKLNYLELDGTGVTDEEKWEFAVKDQIACEKGDRIQIPSVSGLFGYDYSSVKLEVLDNPGNNVISEIQGGNYEYPYFYVLNPGTARLRISWGEFSEEFTVNASGIDANQEMDTEYGVPIQFSTLNEDGQSYTYALKENGELWQIYPEMKVIGQNVKEVAYPYVLTEDGKVYNITDMDNAVMEKVKDLSSNSALKEDGTAWDISEDGTWSKVADDVKQISGTLFYLKNNGELYNWSENTLFQENVEYVVNDGYYITGKGFYQRALGAFMGNIRAVKVGYRFNRMVDGKYTTYDLLVTEEGEVWATNSSVYSGPVESVVNLGSDFAGFSNNRGDWSEGGGQWDWYDTKGNYYKWDQVVTPSETTPIELEYGGVGRDDYTLMKKGNASDNYLYKNGAEMLDGVKDITIMNFEKVFALRNDGSIWDVTGTPKKLGTLNTGDDIVKGDVTGDGKVQIDDLRLVLRSVCQKVTLTSAQEKAADVEQNGKVDIADLRLILRFVCGKVEFL